jgi:hypothetical protein
VLNLHEAPHYVFPTAKIEEKLNNKSIADIVKELESGGYERISQM